MSPPTKAILRSILSKQVRHSNHSVLSWMEDNMVITNQAENVKQEKAKSTGRIDVVVAMFIARNRVDRNEGSDEYFDVGAVYAQRS